jgi:TonB family protein
MSRPRENRLDWTNLPQSDSKVLVRAALIAFVLEFVILTLLGWHSHWLVHPQPKGDTTKYIEAEVYQVPKMTHLMEEKPVAAPKAPEAVLSKRPGQGKKAPEKAETQEQNQTTGGPALAATHGPVAFYAPTPVIPEYLKNKDLNASAVIDFFIGAQGAVTPRLVGSTGNEELDALALTTAKKWQFRPAEQNHKPVDSKIRLRIIFQVH